jgi:hypothetical protein
MVISGLTHAASAPALLRFAFVLPLTRKAGFRLAGLYREGVEPSGSLRKVSDHITIPLSCPPDATDASTPPEDRLRRPPEPDAAGGRGQADGGACCCDRARRRPKCSRGDIAATGASLHRLRDRRRLLNREGGRRPTNCYNKPLIGEVIGRLSRSHNEARWQQDGLNARAKSATAFSKSGRRHIARLWRPPSALMASAGGLQMRRGVLPPRRNCVTTQDEALGTRHSGGGLRGSESGPQQGSK